MSLIDILNILIVIYIFIGFYGCLFCQSVSPAHFTASAFRARIRCSGVHLGETSVEGKDREQDWTEGIGLRKVSVDLTGFSR